MNVNTGLLNFQVSPWDIQTQRLRSLMYNDRNTRGPFFYGQGKFPTMRGLSSLSGVDVSALAQAMANHQIQPSYISGNFWYPGYMTPGTKDPLPDQKFATDATAQQIAGLLGGSVVKDVPNLAQVTPGQIWQGTGVPNANYIELPDGTRVNAGDIAAVSQLSPSIYGLSTLCGYEQILTMTIPGAELGSGCQQNPASNQVNAPVPVVQPSPPVYVGPPTPAASPVSTPTRSVTPIIPSPVLQTTPVNWPTVQTVQAAPQPIYQPAPQQQQQQQQQSNNQTSGGNNTLLYLGIAAVAAFFVFGGKH